MKKSILYFLFIIPTLSYTQSYIGFNTDNYNGIHGVLSNPANIADSNFKADINIISASLNVDNDYIAVNFMDVIKNGKVDFNTNAKKHPTQNNTFYNNVDVLGPSFMMNLKPKHSIALFTRLRNVANVNNISGMLYERLEDGLNSSSNWTIDDDHINITQHAWGELGISYATILMDKKVHFLKGGISLKYLQGLGNSFIQTQNIHVDYDAGAIANGAELDTSGSLTYATSLDSNSGDLEFQSGANGLGIDIGFIYEWRPTAAAEMNSNNYKLKFGVSITDIGSITYKATQYAKYQLNGVGIDENTFNNNDFEDALQILADAGVYTKTDLGNTMKVKLPTSMHLQADWNVINKWFLNFNSNLALTPKNKQNVNNIVSYHTLTPRYETKWFTAQLPITHTALQNTFVGIGFRVGPFYVGSASAITNLFSSNSKGIDAYVGLKIPLYSK